MALSYVIDRIKALLTLKLNPQKIKKSLDWFPKKTIDLFYTEYFTINDQSAPLLANVEPVCKTSPYISVPKFLP